MRGGSLNHFPRKVLRFRAPFELFLRKMVRYAKPPLVVARRLESANPNFFNFPS
jgi:hypothetical protein